MEDIIINRNENKKQFFTEIRDTCMSYYEKNRLCTEEFEETIYGEIYNLVVQKEK